MVNIYSSRIKMLKKVTLRKRVYFLLTALIVIAFTGGLIIVWHTVQIQRLTSIIIKKNIAAFETAEALETALVNQKGFVAYYLLDRDPDWLRRFGEYRQIFNTRLDQAQKLSQNKAQRETIDQIVHGYKAYTALKDRVIDFYKVGDLEKGAQLHKKVRLNFFNIMELCEKYKKMHSEQIYRARQNSQREATRLRIVVVTVIVIQALLVIGLGLLFIRQIITPVKNWMSKNVITIDEKDSMYQATKLMKENGVRMLPVMKKGELTGVVTDRDLKRASASNATTLEIHELLYLLTKIKIKSIMTQKPITLHPGLTVEESAEILLENKISGAPVVDYRGKLVGVITQADIYKLLISLTGVRKKGVLFALKIEDRPGSIREVTDVIRSYDGRLASILSSYDGVAEGYRKVYIRVYDLDCHKLQKLLDDLIIAPELLYWVDHDRPKNLQMTYEH